MSPAADVLVRNTRPEDFDGILGGAPVFEYQTNGLTNVWMAQKVFADNFAGELAFDKDGNGTISRDEMKIFIKKVAGL